MTPPPRRRPGALADGLRLAVGTLTAIPVPPPRRIDRRVAGAAMLLAPAAVVPLAAAVLVAGWLLARTDAPGLLPGALLVTLMLLSTRAMHLDGLADTADGLSVAHDRDKALAVMRRGDTGPSGVAAIVMVLLLDVAALSWLVSSAGGIVLAAVVVLGSRHLLCWSCIRAVPAARQGGLGATVAASVHPGAATVATLLLLLAGAGASVAIGLAWWVWPIVLTAMLAATALLVLRTCGRFGGITGDVLGALVEIGMATGLVVAALCL